MKTSRRKFLQASAAAGGAGLMRTSIAHAAQSEALNAFEIAKRHPIQRNIPGPNFFEGMLLGNGDIGLCVVTRPDALGLHIGKNDVWDIRVDEESAKHVLPFADLLKLWQRAGDEAKRLGKPDMLYLETNIPFFREYAERVSASYGRIWPRPWPCGTLWIHWDPRWVHPNQQRLDVSNGLLTVEMEAAGPHAKSRKLRIACFVDWDSGLVSVSTEEPAPFLNVHYYPELDKPHAPPPGWAGDSKTWGMLPPPEIDGRCLPGFAEFSCTQRLPALAPSRDNAHPPDSKKDRNFALAARLQGAWQLESLSENQRRLSGKAEAHDSDPPGVYLRSAAEQPFRLDLNIVTPRDILSAGLEQSAGGKNSPVLIPQDQDYSTQCPETLSRARNEISQLAKRPVAEIHRASEARWRAFWGRSGVGFQDAELERIWYQNQYFLACCLREGKTAPGLFGNWVSGSIGTAWHSDYHLDYNEQQIYWGVFSSNHAEQHWPYVEVCQNLLGMCETFAREKMGRPGAFFPVSAYPAPSQTIPYPAPPWGYQVSMTPWTVQSLWWQYAYTQDEEYLGRVYPVLRSAARFLAAYTTEGSDGNYHIIPTVSSENWGFTVDYRLNKDCILDLALTEFLLDAVIEASSVLGLDAGERAQWKKIRARIATYPKVTEPDGEVWADVVNAPPEHVYNVPLTLAPVFPAEQVGLGRREELLPIARRTAKLVRLEGGNDLVFQPMARARLGILDLNWFKGQVRYCSLPNGAANDRVRQTGGRYNDSTNFDFMMRMGIWTENLSLPAVLNECLMQSYTGVIHLFPSTDGLGEARFSNLRAAGAFLVSASFDGRAVRECSLRSEKGKTARLVNPWNDRKVRIKRARDGRNVSYRLEHQIIVFHTDPGEQYEMTSL